jgi:tRNA pseudouridine38-40 synthase
MAVIRLLIAYDGSEFHGWARQPGQRTVQGVIEDALALMLPEPARLSVAGRTDAGVHAEGQVASFSALPQIDLVRVQRALNAQLGPEVVVREARRAPDGFNARRSATGREYRYRIRTSPVPDPFTARYTWHRPGQLALGRMRAAARHLEGVHDFASFCRAAQPPSSTERNLRRLAIRASGDLVEVRALADSFLHQMVRSVVGTLVRVGEGRVEPGDMPAILDARSRGAAGQMAPPHGLTLVRVLYGRRGSWPDRYERA